jgi:hypothetical protein
MNCYWDLTQKLDTAKVSRIVAALETLNEAGSAAILDCFQDGEPATLLDIVIRTGQDYATVGWQVERLCRARVLTQAPGSASDAYCLDQRQLNQLTKAAHLLACGVR